MVDLGVYIEVRVGSRQGMTHQLKLSTLTEQPPEHIFRVDVPGVLINVSEG